MHLTTRETALLDKIRGTAIARSEPGLITQSIGATNIPAETIKKICGDLLKKIKIELTIPGLLMIDTPGHEAFTTLRRRGGAIADLAILVIDINEGFKPQTDESLNFLKQFKTPFVVAATKIDRIAGWHPKENECFILTLKEQVQRVQDELDDRLYKLIGQLSEQGFEAERYDRVSDYAKQIAIVPVSGITGEGIPDLLMVLSGIAQKYLKRGLEIKPGEGKGTVLEVKEFRGLGMTIDAIIYDGEVKKGDWLVIGGKRVVKTRVKALLEPSPLKEMRAEKAFRHVNAVSAATGVKIAAPGLEAVVPGSPLRSVRNEKNIGQAVQEVMEEVEEVEFESEKEGAVLKADTLGSLEALIKSLSPLMPIRKAEVGNITKSDIMAVKNFEEPKIFAFGLKVPRDVQSLAKDNRVKIFHSDVIYSLIEEYRQWEKDRERRKEEELLATVTRPGRARVLPGFVFRQSKPAVFGIEVLKGTLKPGYRLAKKGKIVGEVKEVQKEGESVEEAVAGDKVAISMPDVTIGKEIKEGDVLEVFLTGEAKKVLEKIRHRLREDEIELLEEGQ